MKALYLEWLRNPIGTQTAFFKLHGWTRAGFFATAHALEDDIGGRHMNAKRSKSSLRSGTLLTEQLKSAVARGARLQVQIKEDFDRGNSWSTEKSLPDNDKEIKEGRYNWRIHPQDIHLIVDSEKMPDKPKLDEITFKSTYIATFLASYMAGRYNTDCMTGHVGKPYEFQPLEDAVFNADCAWATYKEIYRV